MIRHFSLALCLLAAPAMACETVTAGDLAITGAWSRASVGTNAPGVVYLTLQNAGAADDALLGLSTPAAAMPMLHETVLSDGVATMSHVMAVPVPAGQTVRLEPGGLHGMLMGLTAPLKQGESFALTLSFQNAGDMTIAVGILPLGASGPDCPAP